MSGEVLEPCVTCIRKALLEWSLEHTRSYPWRQTDDAYRVLVAEKLLQQTAVGERVVKAYTAIIERYSAPDKLAVADEDDLKLVIAPLGLCYRAAELIRMADHLVRHHAGSVPDSLSDLVAIPGVGEYTARAVLSFAKGRDAAVVDTNVARFLYRVYGLPGPLPANPARHRQLRELASQLLEPGCSKRYNFAVLDLCAEVCIPRNPRCRECPVRFFCTYGLAEEQQS